LPQVLYSKLDNKIEPGYSPIFLVTDSTSAQVEFAGAAKVLQLMDATVLSYFGLVVQLVAKHPLQG
jgi:hypothetical protein